MVRTDTWPGEVRLLGEVLLVTVMAPAEELTSVAVTGETLRTPPAAETLPAGIVLTQLPAPVPVTLNWKVH